MGEVVAAPRDLPATMQTFHAQEDGSSVYNSPLETEKDLCPKQGDAVPGFAGTCGLCSSANVLRLAGVDVGEKEVVEYAKANGLCEQGHWDPGSNGGTSAQGRQKILEHFGINSSVVPLAVDDNYEPTMANADIISDAVCSGKGVIISVHAHSLWYNDPHPINDLHAITVVSVKKVGDQVAGFYVNDTGVGGTQYYPATKLVGALSGNPINVTNQIIR
ncbi:MAG: hypothetical protein K5682_08015 [Lachnospiraceae bacterium]|nr:hypothetical protein [Lachnospiraceae bacterium]